MSVSSATGGQSRSLILAAMIFAVAMTFIDQTIVSIAAPTIQHDLGLSSSGMQWAINAYLLALAAFFAFGGRLADTAGHRKMVVLGVIIFAGASALCGLTPRGGAAEAWLVAFRAVQGLGGAIMFPAAIAIVVGTFDLHSRGRALALFFGIAGALTAASRKTSRRPRPSSPPSPVAGTRTPTLIPPRARRAGYCCSAAKSPSASKPSSSGSSSSLSLAESSDSRGSGAAGSTCSM